MSLRDVAYCVVHDYPGGAGSLAPRLGKSSTTLAHELTGTGTAKLGLMDAEKITCLTGDMRILQAFAGNLGQMLVPLPVVGLSGDAGEVMTRLSRTAQRFGQLCTEVAKDLADNEITDNELRDIDRQAGELVAAVHHMREMLAAMNADLNAGRP